MVAESCLLAADVVEQQANRGDSSSGGLTPKSEESTPTSASDYGSVAGADVGESSHQKHAGSFMAAACCTVMSKGCTP